MTRAFKEPTAYFYNEKGRWYWETASGNRSHPFASYEACVFDFLKATHGSTSSHLELVS